MSLVLAVTMQTPASAQMNDKWVTLVLISEPDSLDGCQSTRSLVGRVLRQNIIETLIEINPKDGSITPRLARSWERVNDLTWRFHLREGVTFHDGAPFNAETAVVAISRTMNRDMECGDRYVYMEDLTITAKAVGEYTMELATDKPEPILPTRIAVVGIVSPNTDKTKLVRVPVGTGPYTFEHWDAGEEIVVKRNPDYWGEQPVVEGARYIWRGESSVRAAMVEIGEADLAPNISEREATNPETDFSYPNSETTYLRIERSRAPLDDVRVRQALNYAINREGMRGTVLPEGSQNATQIVVPSIAGHNHDLDKKVYPYDPDKARALLAEAKADGVPVDTEIWLMARQDRFPTVNEAMEALLAMFNEVGFNMTLRVLDRNLHTELSNKPYTTDRPPLVDLGQHDNAKGDPVFSVYNKYSCEGEQSFICDPELDQMMIKAAGLTGQERVDTWKEIFRVLYEDKISDAWLYHMVGHTRVNERLDFTPSLATNSEVQLSHIKFK